MMRELLTEEWLKATGFKWHQFDRQPEKQWLLWLGDKIHQGWTSFEDLGVEVCENKTRETMGGPLILKDWFCWIRADTSHLYSRFLHVRHIKYVDELVRLIEGLTGDSFHPEDVLYGSLRTADSAHRLRIESERLDHKWLTGNHKWRDIENDDMRGEALPEHTEAAIKGGLAK